MKHIINIIFILLLSSSAFGGNHDKQKPMIKNVSGKISSVTGEEMPGAKITIKETNQTFYSDLNGNFKFEVNTDKSYSIIVESIGYLPLEIRSNELNSFSELNLKEL